MSAKQLTLAGEKTEKGRTRPDTLVKCYHCGEYVLRTRFQAHEEHDREARKEISERIAKEAEDEDPAEQIGNWYSVELNYTADYRFNIPASDQHEAKEIAKQLVYGEDPHDTWLVNDTVRQQKAIFEDDSDLPDDFDRWQEYALYDALGGDT